jgi:HK97 family phage major capsid protein
MEILIKQLLDSQEAIKNLKGDNRLSFKAAGTMLEADNVTNFDKIDPMLANYISIQPKYSSTLLDYFPKVKVNSANIVLVDETSEDGTVTAVTQGDAKPQVDNDFDAIAPAMQKVAAFAKVSTEMLDDIGYIYSKIEGVLKRRLKNKISDLFLKDLLVTATPTYTSANLTAGTTGTKIKDIIPAVTADFQNLSGFNLNLWLLNQPAYAKMFAEEGTNYLWYAMNDPKIMNSSDVVVENIVGLDTRVFPLYVYNDVAIEIGYEQDDFTKNLVTIRCEARVTWNFTGNCLSGIYNANIDNTLAAIL